MPLCEVWSSFCRTSRSANSFIRPNGFRPIGVQKFVHVQCINKKMYKKEMKRVSQVFLARAKQTGMRIPKRTIESGGFKSSAYADDV